MQVVLAVPHRDLRLALELYLAEEPGLFLAGVATDLAGARALLATIKPEMLIMTWDLSEGGSAALAQETRAAAWTNQIIAVCAHDEQRSEALAAGADAVVSSWDGPDRLAEVVDAARRRARNAAPARRD